MEEKERFEILLEHMNKGIQTVLECHVSLDRKIDRGLEKARLDRKSIKQQMSLFVQTLSGKIDINREKIEQVDQKVDLNREAIEGNREAIDLNRRKIEKIDEKLSSSLEKYADHEERIRVLEVIN